MDSPTSHQQQQQQQQQQQPPTQPSATRNIKNLSIKEFFTTRLMRARSFEGGANSPKDETSNWFDEFKARMTKKSQANSNKQSLTSPGSSTVEESNDESSDYGDSSVKTSSIQPKQKTHQNKEDSASSVKENCDTSLSKESTEGNTDLSARESSQVPQDSNSLTSRIRFSGLRARKVQRISCAESPDFDTASINTIFNRRDSRYEIVKRKPHKLFFSKLFSIIKWIISYLLPFNYNLPWKLLTLINFSFVIIVVGLSRESGPELMTFSFFNGFMCGLLVNTICFMILILSLVVHILPNSQEVTTSENKIVEPSINESLKAPQISFIETKETSHVADELPGPKQEDFSSFEVLDPGDTLSTNDNEATDRENLLDDDDYKGWMIEFIGDYELRNKSDIKLKLIFVKIENRILYLCKPKNSHDAESTSFPVFVHQRQFDLNIARKFSASLLLPRTVRNRQKWVWSKKYPIRLEFLEENEQGLKAQDSGSKMVQLTLFAKSCREKEEWFRRFKRIVEENRIIQGQAAHKRASIQSEVSEDHEDIPMRSLGQSPTPSARQDCVQTSRSSHILGDSKRLTEQESNLPESNSNLIRTKSCELLHTEQTIPSVSVVDQDSPNEEGFPRFGVNDDSTLTRETAELFSQAVEYSNFINSQPNLIYRDYIERVIESSQDASKTSDWFNSLTGRIFFDVFSHNYWSLWFKRKIQRKLYRIRLPYFMETLTLTEIDLGENAPQFLNVVSHSFDSFGLSIDFDMAYSGGLTMTFETKLNLLKIKSDNSSTANPFGTANQTASNVNSSSNTQNQTSSTSTETTSKESSSASESSLETSKDTKKIYSSPGSTRTSGESSDSDSDESDSSSDSSYDEADVDEISDWEDYGAEKTRQSIVRFVDKIASSRYFQQATENRYIKKKLQDISNCPLVLIVKIQSLNGVLTLNVPPPQTDRVWYGFKPNPELTLKALPKMGDREVNLSHVTDWIEKKLAEEFRKILVIPNMEDIVLPVLKSDHLLYVTSTK